MSRVPLIENSQAPLLARRFYERGDPGAIVSALAHVPEMLEATIPFIGAVLGPCSLGPRLREIIVLRTSAVMECRYCRNSHSVIALDSGLSHDEVRALRGEAPIDASFSVEPERALLAWVDRVARGTGEVPDAIAAQLAPHFSQADVVEITLIAATTLMLNRFCSALSLPNSATTLARLREEGFK